MLLENIVKTQRGRRLLEQLETPEEVVNQEGLEVTLRFKDSFDSKQLDELSKLGIDFVRREGEVVEVGAVYQAFVPWETLDKLENYKHLVRVESTWVPRVSQPLQKTSRIVGATSVRKNPDFDLTGQGVTVGDIDSGFDIFHPHFFRADGGYYEWIDANKNRIFDPGIDGVDLNGNGELEQNEKLELLEAQKIGVEGDREDEESGGDDRFEGARQDRQIVGTDEGLETETDWLYVDRNDDSERNVGKTAGFAESTPAYAEPTFVVDDVNGNGYLDPGEKLVRLDTSKFKKIVDGNQTFKRGENLIDYGIPDERSSNYHGAGVTSVIAGGQPRFHERVGLAPDVDLVGYVNGGNEAETDRRDRTPAPVLINDAIESELDILLYEYGIIAMTSIDGSSNYESTLDRAHNKEGIAQITPMGNMNKAEKHTEKQILPGESTSLVFEVDGDGRIPYSIVWGSLYWRQEQTPKIEFINPEGKKVTFDYTSSLPTESSEKRLQNNVIQVAISTTPRGTRQFHFMVYHAEDRRTSIQKGDWTIKISSTETEETVIGRVTDWYSSWDPGVGWKNFKSDEGTLVFPSTADKGVGVAAFGGRSARSESAPGELRGYSGRGPRIDGKQAVDLAAPADPFVAFGLNERYVDEGLPHSLFYQFGGTSGAGPHVAASFALMKEAFPDGSPEHIEEALTDVANHRELTPSFGDIPNPHWGYGKVDVYEAVTGEQKSSDQVPPEIEVTTRRDDERLELDATESSDDQSEALEYRFDTDYDGEYETKWVEKGTYEFDISDFEVGDEIVSRVQVRDSAGNVSGALTDYVIQSQHAEAEVAEADAGSMDTETTSDVETSETSETEETSSQGGDDGVEDPEGCGCYSSNNGVPLPVEVIGFIVVIVGLRRWD